jgi:hypothetical protein
LFGFREGLTFFDFGGWLELGGGEGEFFYIDILAILAWFMRIFVSSAFSLFSQSPKSKDEVSAWFQLSNFFFFHYSKLNGSLFGNVYVAGWL